MKNLIAKEYLVEIEEYNYDNDEPNNKYNYLVYIFENDLVLSPSDITNDAFFTDIMSYEANGSDYVVDGKLTGETKVFTTLELAQSLKGSCLEFDYDEAIKKGWELIKN